MTTHKDDTSLIWPPQPPARSDVGAPPGFRPPSTPSERKAEETTRVAREMTDAQAEVRHAKVDRLRQARLQKEAVQEAEARAAAAAAPPKKGRKRG